MVVQAHYDVQRVERSASTLIGSAVGCGRCALPVLAAGDGRRKRDQYEALGDGPTHRLLAAHRDVTVRRASVRPTNPDATAT